MKNIKEIVVQLIWWFLNDWNFGPWMVWNFGTIYKVTGPQDSSPKPVQVHDKVNTVKLEFHKDEFIHFDSDNMSFFYIKVAFYKIDGDFKKEVLNLAK